MLPVLDLGLLEQWRRVMIGHCTRGKHVKLNDLCTRLCPPQVQRRSGWSWEGINMCASFAPHLASNGFMHAVECFCSMKSVANELARQCGILGCHLSSRHSKHGGFASLTLL
eukprot:3730776-Amphidinium_carterae.1